MIRHLKQLLNHALEKALAQAPEITQLYGCYCNPIRMWATP